MPAVARDHCRHKAEYVAAHVTELVNARGGAVSLTDVHGQPTAAFPLEQALDAFIYHRARYGCFAAAIQPAAAGACCHIRPAEIGIYSARSLVAAKTKSPADRAHRAREAGKKGLEPLTLWLQRHLLCRLSYFPISCAIITHGGRQSQERDKAFAHIASPWERLDIIGSQRFGGWCWLKLNQGWLARTARVGGTMLPIYGSIGSVRQVEAALKWLESDAPEWFDFVIDGMHCIVEIPDSTTSQCAGWAACRSETSLLGNMPRLLVSTEWSPPARMTSLWQPPR